MIVYGNNDGMSYIHVHVYVYYAYTASFMEPLAMHNKTTKPRSTAHLTSYTIIIHVGAGEPNGSRLASTSYTYERSHLQYNSRWITFTSFRIRFSACLKKIIWWCKTIKLKIVHQELLRNHIAAINKKSVRNFLRRWKFIEKLKRNHFSGAAGIGLAIGIGTD